MMHSFIKADVLRGHSPHLKAEIDPKDVFRQLNLHTLYLNFHFNQMEDRHSALVYLSSLHLLLQTGVDLDCAKSIRISPGYPRISQKTACASDSVVSESKRLSLLILQQIQSSCSVK